MSVGFERVVAAANDRSDRVDPTLVLWSEKRAGDALGEIVAVDPGILNVTLGTVFDPGAKPLKLSIDALDELASGRTRESGQVLSNPVSLNRGEGHELMAAGGTPVEARGPIFESPSRLGLLEPSRCLAVQFPGDLVETDEWKLRAVQS
jgi:hypothetical protein